MAVRISVAALLLATLVNAQQSHITCDTPWVVDPNEFTQPQNLSFQLALKDLKVDWYQRLGCRPILYNQPLSAQIPSTLSNITSVVIGNSNSSCIQPYLSAVPPSCLSGWENHCLVIVNDLYFGGKTLIAVGSDTRGAIFAAYSIADVILNIQPFDYWLHIVPDRVSSLSVNSSLRYVPGSPAYKFRAFFVNDEDLFGGLHNDPLAESVWSMDLWDKLYSTLLRLKANAVLPGTNVFPDNPAYTLANRRGLALSSHHYNILGLSPVAQGVTEWFPADYNYQARPDAMLWAWNASAYAWSKYDQVFWTIGYRGAGDEAASCLGTCTVADKADHVSWAIHNQTQLVHQFNPDAEFYTWLWDEGLSYLESGHLKVPPNTTVVFTDNGNGDVAGLEYATSGAGIYTHVAMLDGVANQLTEMVPISRIFGSIAKFVQKKATSLFVLNISDLLPYIMGTLANFQAIYSPQTYFCNQTLHNECDQLQLSWIADWSASTFRIAQQDAQTVATAYAAYYNVSYIQAGRADDLLSNLIRTTADTISTDQAWWDVTVSTRDALFQQTIKLGANDYNWTQASAILCKALSMSQDVGSRVPAGRQQAFATTVLNSISYHCHATSALVLVQAAAEASSKDKTAAKELLLQAMPHMDAIALSLRQAEGTRFSGLFANDDLTCQPRARRAVLSAVAKLDNTPVSKAFSAATGRDALSCRGYSYMYHYQYGFGRTHYPTQFATPDVNMFDWPQAYCTYSDATTSNSSWCIPHPTGAVFKGDSVKITLKSASGAPVRYTVDGTEPNDSSPIASSVTLKATTTIKVQLADVNTAPQPATTMMFTKQE
eukprot:m.98129 g.98129  ORF g.98129 m.98129 type:complete len:828 (+) comp15071_c0_seq1:52-2535(+)